MPDPPPIQPVRPMFRYSLPTRLALLGVLLCIEKVVLSTLVDAQRARDAAGVGAFLHVAQHWGFRYLVTFSAAALLFAFIKAPQTAMLRKAPPLLSEVDPRWVALHGFLVVTLAPVSYFLFRGDNTPVGLAAMAGLWVALWVSAVFAAGVALIPSDTWLRVLRSIGIGWIYAAAVAFLGTGAWLESEKLWNSTTAITFKSVTWVLKPLLPLLSADPASRVMATPNFAVEITEVCSGLEGLGLTLAFSVAWLIYFRREYRFPHALVLIPLSLAAIFGLNVLRIAALMLIGNAGYPEVASLGFHSQAGWIAFNAVVCALVFFSRRSPWLNRATGDDGQSINAHNPTATYLIPLLAFISAGMLSHALSGRFESYYPLRLVAAMAALFACRHSLRALRWRWTWRGPAVGMGMFLLWLGAAHWLIPELPEPESLAAMIPLHRAFWITAHCLTSILMVPIAEELAYHGYLMRRLTHPDFESVPYQSVRWFALTVTAIAFGAAHGILWAPAILVGLAYGLLVIRRESLGEAVIAHATTNGLIAVAVVAANQWQLW